jgi:peptidoglycan/xylan/chitin deacetylase (PgdA/CDA1 family)
MFHAAEFTPDLREASRAAVLRLEGYSSYKEHDMHRPSRIPGLVALLALAGLASRATALQPPTPAAGLEPLFSTERSVLVPASFQAPKRLPGLADRAFLLCWHSFLGRADISTDFSLAELGAQLDALIALGYKFVSLEDTLFGRIEGRLNLVVTIDDGHRTVPSAFLKVFAARGIVPALFVYPAVIGETAYSMDEAQLRSLSDSGCLVGAHGYHHLYVDERLYRSDRATFEQEIFKAKEKVEAMTSLPAYVYAYPFGVFSPITKTEVARAGYAFALAVKLGFVFADPRLNDPYALPRSVVTRENWGELYGFLARNAK